jgi:hypothetical protein
VTKAIAGREVSVAAPKPVRISPEYLDMVRKALRYPVSLESGTAHVLEIPGLEICAKTGTAQVHGKESHGWVAGFFPLNRPRYAFCVLLENVGSSHYACLWRAICLKSPKEREAVMMTARPQKVIVIVVFLILFFGILCLFSSCHQKGSLSKKISSSNSCCGSVGWGVLLLASRHDYRSFKGWGVPLYIVSLATLAHVLFSGRAIMGAQRWISLGEFSFQPSELGTFALILVLAGYFSIKTGHELQAQPQSLGCLRGLLLPLGITLLPTGLVLCSLIWARRSSISSFLLRSLSWPRSDCVIWWVRLLPVWPLCRFSGIC